VVEHPPGQLRRDRLGGLPGDTTVRTGHGESTTVGAEVPHLEEWIVRGH
jgi:hypothetical protein